LSTAEIARAFLTSEATMAQRLVRAKRTLAEARVPFEVPRGEALGGRTPPALEVVYLIFSEGYAARRAGCETHRRLGRGLGRSRTQRHCTWRGRSGPAGTSRVHVAARRELAVVSALLRGVPHPTRASLQMSASSSSS